MRGNTTKFRKLAQSIVQSVLKQRGDKYEGSEDNFTSIGAVWTEIFRSKLKPDCVIDGRDVAKAMVGLKLVRDNIPDLDHSIDGAGYATLWLAHALSTISDQERESAENKYDADIETFPEFRVQWLPPEHQ